MCIASSNWLIFKSSQQGNLKNMNNLQRLQKEISLGYELRCSNVVVTLQQSRIKVAANSWQHCNNYATTVQQIHGNIAATMQQGCNKCHKLLLFIPRHRMHYFPISLHAHLLLLLH
jgi:hypothetical protein